MREDLLYLLVVVFLFSLCYRVCIVKSLLMDYRMSKRKQAVQNVFKHPGLDKRNIYQVYPLHMPS